MLNTMLKCHIFTDEKGLNSLGNRQKCIVRLPWYESMSRFSTQKREFLTSSAVKLPIWESKYQVVQFRSPKVVQILKIHINCATEMRNTTRNFGQIRVNLTNSSLEVKIPVFLYWILINMPTNLETMQNFGPLRGFGCVRYFRPELHSNLRDAMTQDCDTPTKMCCAI